MSTVSLNIPPEVKPDFDLLTFQRTIRELHHTFSKYEFFKTVDDDQVNVMYSIGHAFFNQGKFEKALNIFKFILMYRPLDARTIEACATTFKKMGRFEEAIPTYAAALVFGGPGNPMPSMHIAECLAALGRRHDSEKILQPILDCKVIDSAYTDVHKRAENLLSMLRAST